MTAGEVRLIMVILGMAASAGARAGEAVPGLGFGLRLMPAQPLDRETEPGTEPPTETPTESQTEPKTVSAEPLPKLSLFGDPGSDWLTISGGVAKDFDESTDYNLSLSWSRFVVRDVEFGVEGSAWFFDQEKDPALGLNGTLFLRWHFLMRPSWSIFTDAGMGLLLATDDVPDGGTSFAFTPRAGFGATFRVADDGTRLEAGVRWMHISNARITGDEANPGRDSPMLYFGVIFPF